MAYPQIPTTTIIHTAPPVGPEPSRVTCPHCHQSVMTKLKRESTMRTHVSAILLFLFLCWPCVCVPYCMDSCRNANHYCPHCNAFIGTYQN